MNEKNINSSKQNRIEVLFLFVIFPLSQMLLFFMAANAIHELYSLPMPAYYTILTVICICTILISFCVYRIYVKKTAQKKYDELSNLQAYQKKHYENIDLQRKRMHTLKNDYQTHLCYISDLLERHQNQKALALLDALMNRVNSTKEYPFCPNPVINAVLSDKEHICKQSSILFQTDFAISSCDTISPVYLCNIFSNLLDNAISACQCIENSSKRYIHVTAKQFGDFLHIKITNSANSLDVPKEGHGYGQKILKDIAEKHHGNFQTHYNGETYEAYLSLQFPEERR